MNLREIFESSNAGHNVAICYGRWNPPHKGHRAAWETAAKFGTFYIGTNHNTQGKDDPLPYDVKLECMATIWPEVAGHVIPEQNVFSLAVAVYNKHGEHTHLKVCTDELWLASGLEKYNGKEAAHGYFKFASIQHVATPRLSSATKLRDAVRNGNRDEFSQAAGVDADTLVGDHSFFDLVAHYLNQFPVKAKKVKKSEVAETVNIKQANKVIREMRAQEFTRKPLAEGDIPADLNRLPNKSITAAIKGGLSLPGISQNKSNGSPYQGYRFGLAMASADGKGNNPTPAAGAMSGDPLLSVYTQEEYDMVKQAAKDVMAGPIKKLSSMSSEEVPDVNKTSPVAKPKRNKYGI